VVVVHVEPHRFFTRHKNDLYCTLGVSFAQAVLGETIEIPTLFGPKVLELPRGTRSGQRFLFPGLGVPGAGNCHPGDLVITIHITNKTRFTKTDVPGSLRHPRTESN
jgi:molecular chaperone DnaJ